ncbi:hypothetical protein I3842_10G058100 [Carya illinoinensis]|nr:hypothetical protein I3842_10G058100 [Carya illinoinensis]
MVVRNTVQLKESGPQPLPTSPGTSTFNHNVLSLSYNPVFPTPVGPSNRLTQPNHPHPALLPTDYKTHTDIQRERERERSGMAFAKERENYVYVAKLAEQAERYDEMVDAMKKVAHLDVELSVEERNLLSVGYKNVVGARRASWRILSSIEQKEEAKGHDQNVKRIKEYRHKVESELSSICSDIMSVIDEHLIPACSAGESAVFFYKM